MVLRPRTAAQALAALSALLIGVSVLQHLAFAGDPPVGRLNLDTEVSIGTWFQAAVLLFAAVLAALIGAEKRREAAPYALHWFGLAAVFALLSVDEALALHEELIDPLRDALDAGGIIYFAWVVPGAAAVVLFAALYARFVIALPGVARKLLPLAGALYLSGALAMEAVNGAYASAHGLDNRAYRLLTDLEETSELLGLVTLIYALLSLTGGLTLVTREASSARRAG